MNQEEMKKTIPNGNKNVENNPIEKSSEVPEYVGPKFYGSEHPSIEVDGNHSQESLHGLIEKNIKWSQVIYNQNKKIKHRLTMIVIGNYLRLFLLFAPIIFGILYWPEISASFNQYLNQYLGAGSQSFNLTNLLHSAQIDPSQLQNLQQPPK